LGGSIEEECNIFGQVHGKVASSSSIIVRAKIDSNSGDLNWNSERNIQRQGMDRSAYLLGFFCGRTQRLSAREGAIPPGTKAEIHVTLRRPASKELEKTLRVFFSIGAFGFRSTRAAGALSSIEHSLSAESWDALARTLSESGFFHCLLPEKYDRWPKLLDHAGYLLKHKFRGKIEGLGISAGKNGRSPNALGSAEPRQSSVVLFRPVLIDGSLRLALIEAPHKRILGETALEAHGNRGSILRMAQLH
jgi:hypothetical protein